jgi:small-conductance mechanosensitive channel
LAVLKQSVAENQAALRHYTWIEKNQLSLKGEVKSTKVDSCQYGPDGNLNMLLVRVPDKVDGQIGTVEDISLRSTKFRTSDGSLSAVPNGIMATINLENLSDRKYFLFNPVINLRYETPAEKLLQGLSAIRRILDEAPLVDRQDLRVCLKGFGPSTLDLVAAAMVVLAHAKVQIDVQIQPSGASNKSPGREGGRD